MNVRRFVCLTLVSTGIVAGCSNRNDAGDAKESSSEEVAAIDRKSESKPVPEVSENRKSGLELNLAYLPADAFAAAFMFPQHLQSLPELEVLPFEVIQASIQHETGLDPLDAKQVVAFIGVLNPPAPPEFGFIVRFNKRPRLSEKLTQHLERVDLGDNVFMLRNPKTNAPCFCIMPDNTLLAAPEAALRKMVASRNAKGPLHLLLLNASTDSEVTAALTLSPVRELTKQALQSLPRLPAELRPALSFPDHLESAVISLNVAGGQPTNITLTAIDEDSAEQLEKAVLQGLALGKQMLLSQMSRELLTSGSGGDPVQMATMRYMSRLANVIESRLKPTRNGDKLHVSLQSDYTNKGVMIALLLPAVQAAREAARRKQSKNNLREIALAMHEHNGRHGRLPAKANYDGERPLLSWRVHLLPFLGEQKLYDQFHLDEPWNSEHNRQLVAQMPAVYQNPNLPNAARTNYLVLVGEETAFAGKEGISLDDIKDDWSQTILLVEADLSQAVIWTKPEDHSFDGTAPRSGLGNLRPGGFLVALVDGSAMFVPREMEEAVLRALATREGGEDVSGTDRSRP